MKQAWIVRCLAGGCIIGGRLENDEGLPLTRGQAKRIAKRENDRSAYRREHKLGGCFEFFAEPLRNFLPVTVNQQFTPLKPGIERQQNEYYKRSP